MKLEVFINRGECSDISSFSCFDGFSKLRPQIYRILFCVLSTSLRIKEVQAVFTFKEPGREASSDFQCQAAELGVTQKKKPQAARTQCGFPLSVTCWRGPSPPPLTFQPRLLPQGLQFVGGSCGVQPSFILTPSLVGIQILFIPPGLSPLK